MSLRRVVVGLNVVVVAYLTLNALAWAATPVVLGLASTRDLLAAGWWYVPVGTVMSAAAFTVAAVAHARNWRWRWLIQVVGPAVAIASYALIVTSLHSPRPAPPPTGRTDTTGEGIRGTFGFTFNGALSGRFTDPQFFYVPQQCGATAHPPQVPYGTYGIHSVIGRVGQERVLITMYIYGYEGPGEYVVAPGTGPRKASLSVSRIIGSIYDNTSEGWEGTVGTVKVDPAGLSGSIDADLLKTGDKAPTTLHLQGDWSCSDAQYAPSH